MLKNINRKNMIVLSSVAILSLTFVGCGGESCDIDANATSTQAVAGISTVSIPTCQENGSSENAIPLAPESKIVKQEEGTKVRIWHYQDSTELVCILSGKASILTEDKES